MSFFLKDTFFVSQLGSSRTSPLSESTGALLYSGTENGLNLMKAYDLTFMCDFDLKMFPFDTQHCSIQVRTQYDLYSKNRVM